nr:bifunctional diguanylate cyclase/phosphodiesterase [Lachnospiraceae bacterium]
SDSIMPDSFKAFFRNYDIEAAVLLPVFVHEDIGMYLCFVARRDPRKWAVEDIRFCNDVRRITQTILSRHISQNSLASSYSAIDQILENAGVGICVRDSVGGSYLYENDMYTAMFSDLSDKTRFERTMSEALAHAEILEKSGNLDNKKDKSKEFYAENSGRWFSYTFSSIKWVDERDVDMCTLFDITRLKKYQRQIEQQADLDDLTGLYNRHRFHTDVEKSIRDAVRSAGQGTLIFLDLDDFNSLNDGLGHVLADRFLVLAAEALVHVVGGKAQCYRIGGDQFAILVPYSGADKVDGMVQTILSRFDKPWKLQDNNYYCTICMGIVSFPLHGTTEDVLTQKADFALHLAKNNGKNKAEYYGIEEEKRPTDKLEMENVMRDAVAEGCREFEVYYQPVVDVSLPDHPCCGAEALVRWDSPKLGFLLPDKFIPLAEYLGLIVPIGEHVLLEACRRCRYWNDFGHPEYKIHVNMSVVQLMQEDVVDVVRNTLEVSGIIPENLTIEVTESLAVNDMNRMKKVLEGIHALGVRLALDDFGTGYSSLNHIKEMPLDVIKIDKCFVNDISRDDFSGAFIKTVSDLANSIDVNVVAEGVEDPDQADILGDMNIDMIQGYLYDKPLTQLDFERKYLNLD